MGSAQRADMEGIRITEVEMRYIALFEDVTGASARDCIVDEEQGQVIFVVDEGQARTAVGNGGKNVRALERMMRKRPVIVEYSDDPVRFIKNALIPAKVLDVRIVPNNDGEKVATVAVAPGDKGLAIGKNGRKADCLRILTKRYFRIQKISIT